MKRSILQTIKQYSVPDFATLVAVALMLFGASAIQQIGNLSASSVEPKAERNYDLIDSQAVPVSQTGGIMPHTISEQGCLTTPDGEPITDNVTMAFALYATPAGGSSLWQETHADVAVEDCQFELMLGSKTSIPAAVWNTKPLYLGVRINGDQEMTPRERLSEATPTICMGDSTGWQDYVYQGDVVGVYIDVDTSHCGFTSTPNYFTSITGIDHHNNVVGSSGIYSPTPTGFRIYLKHHNRLHGATIDANIANEQSWHLQWMGVQQ